MFTSSRLSLTALRGLSNAARYQRQILFEFITYFEDIKKESEVVFKERFLNFQKIMQLSRQLQSDKTIEAIKKAIEQFGQGRMTARYATSLLKLKREVEKFGCQILSEYCRLLDWHYKYLPRHDYVVRNIASKIAVHHTHQQFKDKMLSTFFSTIDNYISDRESKSQSIQQSINAYAPKDNDDAFVFMIKYALIESKAVQKVYYMSCNVPLTDEKVALLKKLKCDLLELISDSPDNSDINGFMRAMYFHLLIACEKNKNTGSEGSVNVLLTEQLQWIEQYYPEEAARAKLFYNDDHNIVDDLSDDEDFHFVSGSL